MKAKLSSVEPGVVSMDDSVLPGLQQFYKDISRALFRINAKILIFEDNGVR